MCGVTTRGRRGGPPGLRVVVVDRLTLDPYVDVVLRLLVSPFSFIGLGEGIEGFQVLDRGGPDGGSVSECWRIVIRLWKGFAAYI